MNIFSKPAPILSPEDLGIDLEEDSTDVGDDEVANATMTDDTQDFTEKVVGFVGNQTPTFELRRKSGILFSRVSLDDGQRRLFNVEWMRRKDPV
jgi:hypothetical protein